MDHWYSGASSGSVITSANWNELVQHTYISSSGYWGASSNIVAIKTWMNNSGNKYSQAYASTQNAMYSISHADDITWDSETWHNSSLMWNKDNGEWIPKPSSGTGGVSNLSDLTIDANKDWNSKSIYNATSISSQKISSGTIIGNTIKTNSYISSTTGIYANFISANNSNISTSDVAWSGAIGYVTVSSLVNTLNTWYEASGEKLSTISGSLSDRIDALGGFNPISYITSSNAIERFSDSSNINRSLINSISSNLDTRIDSLFAWSSNTKGLYQPSGIEANYTSGWALVSTQSTIAHEFGTTPSIVGVSPSGTDTFSYSVSYDATNITVYLSVDGKHCVNWFAGGPSSGDELNLYVYPENVEVNRDSLNKIYFSGQEGTYVYSGTNTIIISSSTSSDVDMSNLIASSTAIERFSDSSNINWTKITAISSGFDGRLDTLEGYDEFDHELYITSSNAQSKFLHSGVTLNAVSANRIWTDGYISSQQGVYTHFISANNSNLAGTINSADFKASSGTWTFVSSQAISGGTIIGGLHYPADYIVYRKGETYYSINSDDGTVLQNDTDFSTLINNTIVGGKTIYINPGDYWASASINIPSGTGIRGEIDSTTINVKNGDRLFVISGTKHHAPYGHNSYIGNLRIRIHAPYETDLFYIYSFSGCNVQNTNIENINIWSAPANWFHSNVIHLHASGTYNTGITLSSFRNINAYRISTGILMTLDSAQSGWINGNNFDNIILNGCKRGIYCDVSNTTLSSDNIIAGNMFNNIHVQCVSGNGYGSSYGYRIWGQMNKFTNCYLWDWQDSVQANYGIEFIAGSRWNYMDIGGFPETRDKSFIDNGTDNTIYNLEDKILKIPNINVKNNLIVSGTTTIAEDLVVSGSAYISGTIYGSRSIGADLKFDSMDDTQFYSNTQHILTIYGGEPNSIIYSPLANGHLIHRVTDTGDIKTLFHTSYGHTFDYANNLSEIKGGDVTGDDLILYPNSLDKYSTIRLEGSGNILISSSIIIKNGSISSQAGVYSYFVSASKSNLTAQMGGALSSDLTGDSYLHGLNSMDYLSSQAISGGTVNIGTATFGGNIISGLADPTFNSGAANKHYVDTISSNLHSQIGAGALQGTFLDNIGSDFSYGISGMDFVSSQSMSGGTYKGETITVTGIVSSQTGIIAHYVSANNSNLSTSMGGTLESNLDGDSYTYGADDLDFVSSQAMSGGSILTGDLTLNANTISGLILPTWPSAAASKRYVDVRTPTATEPDFIAGTIWMSGNTTYCKPYYCSSNTSTKWIAL